jgi:hypothetical protein
LDVIETVGVVVLFTVMVIVLLVATAGLAQLKLLVMLQLITAPLLNEEVE